MYGLNAAAIDYDGKNKYIRITDIDDLTRSFTPNPLTSPNTNPDNKYKLQNGDLLFARTVASVGKTYLYREEDGHIFFAGFLIRFSIKKEANPYFIYSQTINTSFTKWVSIMSMRSGQPGINAEEFKSYPISLPTLPEQQKIADFLSVVDERIRLLTQKQEKLSAYKKGVMQQLFPKTGEQNPSLRFRDAHRQPFPDWEEKKLGDIYNFKSTNSFSREKLNYEVGTVKNIHYGDIHTKLPSHINIKKEILPFINKDVNLDKIDEQSFVENGDLIFADASENYDDIGKAIEIVETANEFVLSGLHTFLARRKNQSIIIGFGGHLFQSESVRLSVKKIAQGTKVLGISMRRLEKINLLIPSTSEQQKIADFLSAIDRQISQVSQQLTQTRTFKKGLLQGMFL